MDGRATHALQARHQLRQERRQRPRPEADTAQDGSARLQSLTHQLRSPSGSFFCPSSRPGAAHSPAEPRPRAWIKNRRGCLTPVSEASGKSRVGKLSESSDARADGRDPQLPHNQPRACSSFRLWPLTARSARFRRSVRIDTPSSTRQVQICTYNRASEDSASQHHRATAALTSRCEMGNTPLPPASHPCPESKTARGRLTPELRLGQSFSL